MQQDVTSENYSDEQGNPAGGVSHGLGFSISWQNGPLGRGEDRQPANGAFVEGVIEAARQRLDYYQTTRFKCRETALAITKLEEALHWCQHRTANREARQVEGTHAT